MEDIQDNQKVRLNTSETPKHSTTPSFHLPPGRIIGERYEVKSLIGQGGMGCVYLVEQLFLHKVYALKTLNPGDMSDLAWRRFQKEAQATSAFEHPSLIKVHDFGMIDDSQPYFVMDYFEGETLAAHIEKHGGMPLSDVLAIFSQVCFALAHAHKQGVIHRDLKPSNIMIAKVDDDYQVKVVDFGIAKLINASDHETLALTRTGEVFGTPYYMSPEQCLGIAIDHRADIYSLGCVFFQALTGMPPFIGETALSIMMQHQTADPTSLKEASLGKTFPEAADRVIRKMLQKKPDDRYQNLLEVAGDLDLIKLGQRVVSQKHSTIEKKSDKPVMLVLGIAAAVLLLIVAFVMGRSSVPVNESPVEVTKSERLGTAADSNKTGSTSSAALTSSPSKYYSEDFDKNDERAKRKRTFHFGDDKLPGVMVFPASVDCMTAEVMKDGKKVFARGDVVVNNFEPFTLLMSDEAAEDPRLIERFRPDEVGGLVGTAIDSTFFKDKLLVACSTFENIKKVKLEKCPSITDDSLRYLDRLPNLVELSLNGTSVTGDAVGKMHNIKKFRMLDLGSLMKEKGSGVLPHLAGSTAIEELNLRRGRLEDSNAGPIATLPNLKIVNMSASAISDITIRKLQNLKHLEDLNIYACRFVTAKSFPVLAKFPSLKVLRIGLSRDPDVNRSALSALAKLMPPGCTIKYDVN